MPQRDRRWVLEKGKIKTHWGSEQDGIKFGEKYFFSENYGVWDGVYAQIYDGDTLEYGFVWMNRL